MSNHPRSSQARRVLAIAMAGAVGLAASAQAATWTNPVDGLWSDATKWDTGVPGNNVVANLTNTSGTYVVTYDEDLYDTSIRIGTLSLNNSGSNTVTLNVDADNLRVAQATIQANSTVNVNDGGLLDSASNISINGGGTLAIADGGAAMMVGTNASVIIGNSSLGILEMTGGLLSSAGTEANGRGIFISTSGNNNTSATASVSGGSVINAGALFMARAAHTSNNRDSVGTLTISGDETTWFNAGSVVLGRETGPATPGNVIATLNLQGGQFTTEAETVVFLGGTKAVGILNVSGGSFGTAAATVGEIRLGTRYTGDSTDLARGDGTLQLSGGQVHTRQLTADTAANTDGVATINFTGGELHTGGTAVNNGSVFTVGNGEDSAILHLAAGGVGVHSFADDLVISANASLTGSGTIDADTLVTGTLAPGNSIGAIVFNGNELTLAGVTSLQLAGASTYDVVQGVGMLNFGGTLSLSLLQDYAPSLHDSFVLFDFASSTGAFATFDLPTLDGDLVWDTSALHSDGVLTVIPEPASLALMLSAMLLAAPRRRC